MLALYTVQVPIEDTREHAVSAQENERIRQWNEPRRNGGDLVISFIA